MVKLSAEPISEDGVNVGPKPNPLKCRESRDFTKGEADEQILSSLDG